VVNRLSPSNIRKTATEFVKEWEKSLIESMETSPGTRAVAAVNAEEDKENASV
jgi:hypothetical protein